MNRSIRWLVLLSACALPSLAGAQVLRRLVDTVTAADIVGEDTVWIVIKRNTAPQPKLSLAGKIAMTAYRIVYFPVEVPSMVLHENMHKIAFRAFGVQSRIEYQSFKPWIKPDYSKPYMAVTDPDPRQYEPRVALHPWKQDVIGLAPYAADLLIKDRLIETFVRRSYRPLTTDANFRHDLRNALLAELSVSYSVQIPFANAGKDGDIGQVIERHSLKKWAVVGVIEAAYVFSSFRIMKTSVCGGMHCAP